MLMIQVHKKSKIKRVIVIITYKRRYIGSGITYQIICIIIILSIYMGEPNLIEINQNINNILNKSGSLPKRRDLLV